MKAVFKNPLFRTFIASICSIAVLCSVQTKAEDGKSLSDQWTFGYIVTFEGNVQQVSGLDGPGCCELPVEMNIRKDAIFLCEKNHKETVKMNPVVRKKWYLLSDLCDTDRCRTQTAIGN